MVRPSRIKNENGVIFVTVTMIIIVLMVLTVTIISLNVSQTVTTEGETHRLQADTLAEGVLYRIIAQQQTGGSLTYSSTYNLDGYEFDVSATNPGATSIYETEDLSISVDY
jgi:hypothetical protein